MQQLDTTNDSKVVRISNNNYQKLVSQGKYGDTFDLTISIIVGTKAKLHLRMLKNQQKKSLHY